MQLLYTNPLPSPEFVSLSLVLQPDPNHEEPSGGMGEPLLLASPLSTISYNVAQSALKELHKYLSCLAGLPLLEGKQVSIHDQIVAELMQDDENLVMNDTGGSGNSNQNNKLQVFRPLSAHGMGLHYRLLRDDKVKTDFASLVLASSRSSANAAKGGSGSTDAETRKIEKQLLGVLVTVGLSGIPYAHCSSSLQYGLSQRVNDCVGVLTKRIHQVDVGAAKTILSTLLVTEDEVRKTNEVADAAIITAIPESGEETFFGNAAKNKGNAFKNVFMSKGGSGGTNIHVGIKPTSNDLSRMLIERLNVLSVADSDSLLRPFETSGQQRKANLDLTGTKSRFRKRKTDSSTNADLENFDYRGPVRDGRLNNRLLLRQQNQQQQAQQQQQQSSMSSFQSSFAPPLSSAASVASSRSASSKSIRQHRSDAHTSSRRNRAVPTLSAPRGDVSSSRRSSTATSRSDDPEDDVRSRRSGKSHGSARRNTGDSLSNNNNNGGNWFGAEEDISESRSMNSNSNLPRLQVNIALNEDLTCSYKFSKMTSCSVEGVIQVQVKSNARSLIPFQLLVRDPSGHIQTLQENKKFAEDSSPSDRGDKTFTIGVPKADNYFPLIRYKCSNELRPVPIRVQTRVKVDGGYCRVALQISSNPHNEGSLTDLTIIMGVANDIRGGSLVTQPAGGVWNASKRSVIWCVSELGDGEKFQLQARFEMDESAAGKDEHEVPKFPVLVRCQCMYAQLSDVEVAVQDIPELQPAEVAMKVARRFRLSHQERS